MEQRDRLISDWHRLMDKRGEILFDRMCGIITQVECVEQLGNLRHNRSIIEQELQALSLSQWLEDLIHTELTT